MSNKKITVDESVFDKLGEQVIKAFTVTNQATGFSCRLISYGASVQSIKVKEKSGKLVNTVLGFDTIDEYVANPYFGATIGRVSNRVANAKFELANAGGVVCSMEKNDQNTSCNHSGSDGLHRQNWLSAVLSNGVKFTYSSPDGESGLPGLVTIEATYSIDAELNKLVVDYKALSEQLTPVNLTNHTFFSLEQANIYDQQVKINAQRWLDYDPSTNLVTGKINKVEDSNNNKYDFREYTRLGDRIAKEGKWPQEGFDNYFVVKNDDDQINVNEKAALSHMASAKSLSNGIKLDVYSNQNGLFFYTGNFIDINTSDGRQLNIHDAFCLETMNYPDSMNHAHFPSCLLDPNNELHCITQFEFTLLD